MYSNRLAVNKIVLPIPCVSLYRSLGMGNSVPQSASDGPESMFVGMLAHLGMVAMSHEVNRLEFEQLAKVCKEILDRTPGAEDYVFPTEKADPAGVWDEVDPSHNNFRFMVYIVWLSKQENSVPLYSKLKKDRREPVNACIQRLLKHIRDVELQEEMAGTV